MSLFTELPPLFPETQGIRARTGLLLGMPKKGGESDEKTPNVMVSGEVPDEPHCSGLEKRYSPDFFVTDVPVRGA